MIKREDNGFWINCDFCIHDLFIPETNWREMIKIAKAAGWVMRKENDEWIHYCEDCAKERLL